VSQCVAVCCKVVECLGPTHRSASHQLCRRSVSAYYVCMYGYRHTIHEQRHGHDHGHRFEDICKQTQTQTQTQTYMRTQIQIQTKTQTQKQRQSQTSRQRQRQRQRQRHVPFYTNQTRKQIRTCGHTAHTHPNTGTHSLFHTHTHTQTHTRGASVVRPSGPARSRVPPPPPFHTHKHTLAHTNIPLH